MKIYKKIDPLGRIVIPSNLRKEFNLNANDLVSIQASGTKIILEKEKSITYNLIIKKYCKEIAESFKTPFLICDEEKIIYNYKCAYKYNKNDFKKEKFLNDNYQGLKINNKNLNLGYIIIAKNIDNLEIFEFIIKLINNE